MLRRAVPSDAATFADLRADQVVQHLLMANPDPAGSIDRVEEARAWIARRETAGWFRILDEGQGAMGFAQISDIHRKNNFGWFGMALLPLARGRGLGTRLLAAATSAAVIEVGLRKLLIQVRADNYSVVELHIRQGWSVVGNLRSHYDDGVTLHDVVILEKLLA